MKIFSSIKEANRFYLFSPAEILELEKNSCIKRNDVLILIDEYGLLND